MRELRPNIVLILADDFGWGDAGCYNPASLIPTPNMDRIAAEGVRMTNAHAAASVCTPSRYALLTGRYAWRTRLKEGVFYGYCRHLIETERETIASLLKKAGYRTACIGKWHVGMDWKPKPGDAGNWPEGTPVRHHTHRIASRVDHGAPIANGPTSVGFDYFYGNAACSTGNEPLVFIENDRATAEVAPRTDERGRVRYAAANWNPREVDDVLRRKAVDWMGDHLATEGERPFFLYLALSSPHAPLVPPVRLQGATGAGARGDMCAWFDESVGYVDSALRDAGIAEDTLVIVTSDNGSEIYGGIDMSGRRRMLEDPTLTVEELREAGILDLSHQPSGPWRGFKTDIWEGGTRIPLLVRRPGHVEPGTVSDQPFCLTDLLATFAGLTGIRLPDDAGEDSFNLLPAWFGGAEGSRRPNLITHSYTGAFSVRLGRWKLIFHTRGSGGHMGVTPGWQFVEPGTPGQLYDIDDDPAEQNNLWTEDNIDLILDLTYQFQQIRALGRSRPRGDPHRGVE